MNRPLDLDTRARVRRSLARRRSAERRFRLYGLLSVVAGLLVVALLFGDLLGKGYGAFSAHQIRLEISFAPSLLGVSDTGNPQRWVDADYGALIDQALAARFPAVVSAAERRHLRALISVGAVHRLQQELAEHPDWLGQKQSLWLLGSAAADRFLQSDDGQRRLSPLTANQRHWLTQLEKDGDVRQRLNLALFTHGDSRQAELAGIRGALAGSLWALLVTLCLSLPIGVAAALYLQEFAPRNRWTRFIELNISHLASLPPIVFGLLGLALFIGLFGLPGSVPLLAGLVLTLMTLPTIIITSRAAIRAVPLSVRQGALALGASPMQVVLHQVLPLALPGVLTGAVFSFARALGEAAPLLLIGMLVFVVGVPGGLLDPATVLPVQIYLWASNPDPSFVALAAAATLVLLALLLVLNIVAVIVRRRLEKRW